MEEKYNKVYEWLAELFSNNIPEFEVCERTVDILFGLMEKNKQRNKEIAVTIEGLENLFKEYAAESIRVETLLNDLSITPNLLPEEIQKPLEDLAKSAEILGVHDPFSSCMDVEMCNLFRNDSKVKAEIKKMERLITKAEKENSTLECEVTRLREALRLVCENVESESKAIEKEEGATAFVKTKADEYKRLLNLHEVELSRRGFSPSLSCEELLKRSEELSALQKELSHLKTKMDLFHGLPPDPEIVAKEIAEAKLELANLEELTRN